MPIGGGDDKTVRSTARLTGAVPTRFFLTLPLLLLSSIAFGATATWSANPIDRHWSNGANWVGGSPPNPGDNLVFPATSTIQNTDNDLADGIAIHTITFNGNGYRLSGHAITLGMDNTGVSIRCASGEPPGSDAISLPIIIMVGVDGILTAEGCTLTLSGAISGTGGLGMSYLGVTCPGKTEPVAVREDE
jgi:hypothetical protein